MPETIPHVTDPDDPSRLIAPDGGSFPNPGYSTLGRRGKAPAIPGNRTLLASEWAGKTKAAKADPIDLAATIRAALRPHDPGRRTAILDTARAALFDPQALALIVAVRELGAGTTADLDAALALVDHSLNR